MKQSKKRPWPQSIEGAIDTPITDSRQAYEWSINNGAISADFSRGLERENTQLAARVKELEGDGAMLEALGRHVEFRSDEGFPVFNMIFPERRREIYTPLRVELREFLRRCFNEDDAIRSAMKHKTK